MDTVLRNTCEKFIANQNLLRESFKREGIAMHLMGAAAMTGSGGELTLENLKKCEDFLDTKAGVFSSIRGILKMPMIVNMALSGKAEDYYETVQRAYGDIKENRGTKDERFFLAAMIIASAVNSDEEITADVETAGKIFELTDASGRFFADMSCFVTASSIAAGGDVDIDAYAERFALCKEELRLSSGIGKVPEDLCMLIAARDGDINEMCGRVLEIADALGDKKISLGTGDAASMLAVLATLDMSPDEIAKRVSEASAFLKEQKGFGFMGVGKEMRYLYASMLVCMSYQAGPGADDAAAKATTNNAIVGRFIMQQQLIILTTIMTSVNMANMMMVSNLG